MGLYEGAQEVLALADYHGPAPPRFPDCLDTGICGGAVYLYLVLKVASPPVTKGRLTPGEFGFAAFSHGP